MKSLLLTYKDYELQQLAANGDTLAFEVIFDRYWKRLYNYAFKIYKDEAVCEDIVQELFISLWNNLSVTPILSLESYLMRAVKYKVANHIRSLKFTKEHEDVLNDIAIIPKNSSDLEFKEFESELFKVIDTLTPKCKEVFLLSRFENCTNNEIASKLNLSVHTVEKHISNALKHLRNNITDYQLLFLVTALYI
ncbi:RNA polymerase sigma-70 factor [Flavobacterium fluviatile]|uniref:RNA polymerase sigma-70 factor n=1 Tax=Flavobacterium fluviatile TaxID=1862387 RepID=UPI0013D5F934|nr:RNA polymerase sigma-70 factor [Flavobacterium fluviatile]